jgi:tetratricopeptide (TPR) repeat protein
VGRREEAGNLLKRALALNPNDAYAVKLSAYLAFERGDLDSALAQARRTLALMPDQADAYSILGDAWRDIGRLHEARDAYIKAIDLDPNRGAYYFALANCTKFDPADRHFAAMESLAAKSTELPKLDRIYLDFALGKAYADLKEYRRSFQHLLAANAAKRATVGYDERSTLEFFDRIEQTFSAELMAAKSGGGDPSRRPIFVLGMPRSGTTLVEQMLASHPAVYGAGELTTLRDIAQIMRGPPGKEIQYPDYVQPLDQAATRAIGAEYIKRLAALAPQGERVTDKMPSNYYFVGLIHLILPNAVIIHTVRDPIDTCLSCFSTLFRLNEQLHTYGLGEIGRYYVRYQQLMMHWRRVLPQGRILDVRYEEMVGDPEGQARRILEHCGLPWDDRCLAFHQTDRPVRTASAAQVRQPIYKNAVGRWRAYEEWLGPLLAELGTSEASYHDMASDR